ncbi:MAG TPA: DUF6152 family protein [Bryobacteraceae bacterium]
MRHQVCAIRIVTLAVWAGVCAWGHHSPSAEFDMTKRITLTGTLTQVDWINPHIKVAMEVKSEAGKVENWGFESNPPAWFRRVGVSRADLAKAIGQTVKVEGVRAKDGSFYGYLQKIMLPDGTSLELVSPNAAAEGGK